MPRRARGNKQRNLDNLVKIIGLLLALGAPVVSLISMMSSYKNKQEELTRDVENIAQQVSKISESDNSNTENSLAYRQMIMDNNTATLRLGEAQDNTNEKVLELWKQTSANNAKIDELQTEIILLRNAQTQQK